MAPQGGPQDQEATRVAVVDIGSNSIRLVVFDRPSRSPLPVFNEKVLCGLGRGIDATGRLNDAGAALALPNLVRFVRLAQTMGVRRLDLLATAAVRDAANGAEFVAEVERRCGVPVRIISGEDEARLSALGVVAGIPEADGLMGDLGGASLELVALEKSAPGGVVGSHVTLPLGPLRLKEVALGDREAARAAIDAQLDRVPWLTDLRGRTFYPVGGAWRTLARVHMEQTKYPLHVIHHYTVARRPAEDLARVIGRLGKRSLASMSGLSRRRIETLPFAALLLERLLRRVKPERVVFSAYGLREGHLFSQIPPDEQDQDPLLTACAEIAAAEGRFGAPGPLLQDWIEPLFPQDGPAERRLRLAICQLSDIAWREHPDYRAQQAYMRILRLPVSGIDHFDRAAAAFTIAIRYGGNADAPEMQPVQALLSDDARRRAVIMGLALRLAYSLSGATPELMRRTGLTLAEDSVTLLLPEGEEVMLGEAVQRRLEALGRALNRGPKVGRK
jgi:exopolyphosphatase / guanosine-5'-triphosphate,3'-diphosphate pyrophosphatase